MQLTKKQKNCSYCHSGWFDGKSGWQGAEVLYSIDNDGALQTFINGVYGYCEGIKFCPFCGRPLSEEVNDETN